MTTMNHPCRHIYGCQVHVSPYGGHRHFMARSSWERMNASNSPPIIHQNKVKALRCLLAKQCGPPMVPSAITGMSLVNLVASVHLNSLILIAIFDQKAPMNISSSPITLQGCMKTMGVFCCFLMQEKLWELFLATKRKKVITVLFCLTCAAAKIQPILVML